PPVPLAERARTDGPAALACGSLDVAGQVIFVVQHVDVPGRGGCAAGGVDAAQYLRRRAGIVETARAVLPRGCGECIDAPGAVARIGADGLEAASHVGPLARVDQPCRAELQLLDADPHADAVVTSRCRSPFDEQVGRVEPVLVHRRRPRDAATGPRTGQLREAAPVLAQLQVGEGRVALHPGTPRVLWLQTVAGIAGVLVAPAQVAADAEAHVRADRTMLPARAAAARGAGAALAAEIILETPWTEPCPRGIGCQQQGDPQPRRPGDGPTRLRPAAQFPASGRQGRRAASSNSLDARGARLRQWRAWRAPDEMAHAGRAGRIRQQLPEPRLQRAFVFGHPLVLAQVLQPRAVDEVLEVGARGFGVLGDAPLHGAIAATAAPEAAHHPQEFIPPVERDPVLDRDQDRA